jgi:hypothetical protein
MKPPGEKEEKITVGLTAATCAYCLIPLFVLVLARLLLGFSSFLG